MKNKKQKRKLCPPLLLTPSCNNKIMSLDTAKCPLGRGIQGTKIPASSNAQIHNTHKSWKMPFRKAAILHSHKRQNQTLCIRPVRTTLFATMSQPEHLRQSFSERASQSNFPRPERAPRVGHLMVPCMQPGA